MCHRSAAFVVALILLAACEIPNVTFTNASGNAGDAGAAADAPDAPDAPPDAPSCPSCQLLAVEPSVATTGDTLALEGTFGDTATVTFPGGVTQAAIVLGPHRATVTVPAAATAGALTVTTQGTTLGPLPFRRAAFTLGLQPFNPFPQAAGPRQATALVNGRNAHTSVEIGGWLYVIGGRGNGTGTLSSVERAAINGDGSLGPFATVAGVALVTARSGHTSVVIGGQLYVIGGRDGNGNILTSVEQATIAADGSLGPFATVAGVALVTARQLHTSTVIGNGLYVVGGASTNFSVATVECATIGTDGSLGPFAIVAGVTLVDPVFAHTAEIVGGYLYAIGGRSIAGENAVERAPIHADGSLGTFAIVTGVTLVTGRDSHTSAVLGHDLYVIAGEPSTAGILATIEHATINADGSLTTFAIVPGVAVATARYGHTSAVVGDFLYVIGGSGGAGNLASVEQTALDADGALGAFAAATGVTLATQRSNATSAVIGGYLYVLGGEDSSGDLLSSVERAPIHADGSLGTFATVAGVALVTPRHYVTSVVAGNFLYVLGGLGSADYLDSVEQAPINADGSLGTFTTAAITLASPCAYATSAVIGANVYVLGGFGGPSNGVQRAPINADGSLAAFTTTAGVALVTGRASHTSAVIGASVYVIGGESGGFLTSVEQAPINADGSLGTFATVTGVALAIARSGQTSAVVGDQLYVIGGAGSDGSELASIEAATIQADGSLGAFTTTIGTAAATRADHVSAVLGNYVYLLGGYGISTANNVARATLP